MAELDAELAERVARWCAEAGRQAGLGEIRRALAPLGWDDLLAVRALLADPPPTRPLGPFALADIARGAPPDVAAEREREGRYAGAARGDDEVPPPPAPTPAPARRAAGRPRKRGQPLVIHRARDRAAPPVAAPEERPRLADLRRPEGRGVLERLVRDHGARRAALARALAAGWVRDDGRPPDEEDVAALLDHHGVARAFTRRERDEVLHALRAAGGLRPAAAARLDLDVAGLEAALARLGLAEDAERLREARRAELRRRGTLAERLRLVLQDEERVRELGLLDELEADLRARLPEHVRALRLGSAPLEEAFASSLGLDRGAAQGVAARFGVALSPAPRAAERKAPRAPRPRGERPRGERPGRAGTAPRGGKGAARPRGGEPSRPRPPRGRPPGGARRPPRRGR